jgi:hypothetical protein
MRPALCSHTTLRLCRDAAQACVQPQGLPAIGTHAGGFATRHGEPGITLRLLLQLPIERESGARDSPRRFPVDFELAPRQVLRRFNALLTAEKRERLAAQFAAILERLEGTTI